MNNTKTLTVADVMTKSVISVDASLAVNEAAKMMEDTKVGAVIVMENNTPVGIVTDRDFAIKIVAHAYQITTPVKQIMSSPLFSINSDESVRTAADLMHDRGIRKLPVIDNETVIGIITATDIVNSLAVCVEDDREEHTVTSRESSGLFGWMDNEDLVKPDGIFDSEQFNPGESQ